jgi:Uncharacterized protein conserved in bacteria
LQSEPNNASYLDSLGWVEFRKGQFDRALDDLLRAAKTAEREDPVVFEHIGDTYLKLNRTREALEAWQKACRSIRKQESSGQDPDYEKDDRKGFTGKN